MNCLKLYTYFHECLSNNKLLCFRYGIDRIVEDMIQEAMAKGEFDNLSNAGKPLQDQNYNPYVDTVTHKLNQVCTFLPSCVICEAHPRPRA